MNLRKYRHISMGGRSFMSQRRMRQIRFEESVVNSEARRKGIKPNIQHHMCYCGSEECLGVPVDESFRMIKK